MHSVNLPNIAIIFRLKIFWIQTCIVWICRALPLFLGLKCFEFPYCRSWRSPWGEVGHRGCCLKTRKSYYILLPEAGGPQIIATNRKSANLRIYKKYEIFAGLPHVRQFADPIFFSICGFAICGPSFCGLKTSANPQIPYFYPYKHRLKMF